VYLLIGVIWTAFWIKEDGNRVLYADSRTELVSHTVLVNTFIWPIFLPLRLYVYFKNESFLLY
jgi:hypothetical protein